MAHAAPSGEVVTALGTDVDAGLSSADAALRLRRDGPNELPATSRPHTWQKVARQFGDPLVLLLLGAILIAVAAWCIDGADGVPWDPLVIVAIVVANAVLGYVQEAKAEAALAALERMTVPTATVVRNTQALCVPARELVRGDIMLLAEGGAVAADGRLTNADALLVNEATLTGESQPVAKQTDPVASNALLGDRLDMVFAGTSVTEGQGRAVVTAVGARTEFGRIAALLDTTRDEPSPLQVEIRRVGRALTMVVLLIAVAVVGALLASTPVDAASDVVDILVIGVSLAVAAVPEGLPAIVSVVLALGVERLAERHAIVRRLSAVEALGSASVICSDKTGTLTTGQMAVRRMVTPSGTVDLAADGQMVVGQAGDGPGGSERSALVEADVLLRTAALATETLAEASNGTTAASGDMTEIALVEALHSRDGAAHDGPGGHVRRLGVVPFSSARRRMSTVQVDSRGAGEVLLVTKGAPESILPLCRAERVAGTVRVMTDAVREQHLVAIGRLGDASFRTLAVGYRSLPAPPIAVSEDLERDLIYLGTVGIVDPPRPEARTSIAEARRAGIRVAMITGDHPRTAVGLASGLGIEGRVLTGAELDDLDDPTFSAMSDGVGVYARVVPEQKLRIVEALQRRGEVVAMTGDGVNDAPAVKRADVGITMGSGTDVAREAADIVLADDNFATIVTAVREGRAILANLRKTIRYLLSSNAGEVLTMFLGIAFAGALGLRAADAEVIAPLLAAQILWINLLTDSLPALALGVDPPGADLMQARPRGLHQRIIDGPMTRQIALVGLVMALSTLLVLDAELPGGLIPGSGSVAQARTAAFTTLVLAQLFNSLASRSDRATALRGLGTNPPLLGAIAIAILLQVAVVHLPLFNDAFGTTALDAAGWTRCCLAASSVLWVDELRKLVVRRRASSAIKRPAP